MYVNRIHVRVNKVICIHFIHLLYNWSPDWSITLYFIITPYLTKIVIRSFTNWYLFGSISVYGYEYSQLEETMDTILI